MGQIKAVYEEDGVLIVRGLLESKVKFVQQYRQDHMMRDKVETTFEDGRPTIHGYWDPISEIYFKNHPVFDGRMPDGTPFVTKVTVTQPWNHTSAHQTFNQAERHRRLMVVIVPKTSNNGTFWVDQEVVPYLTEQMGADFMNSDHSFWMGKCWMQTLLLEYELFTDRTYLMNSHFRTMYPSLDYLKKYRVPKLKDYFKS